MGRKRLFTKEKVLQAIRAWMLEHGVAPTIEELRRDLGVGSTRTIHRYLGWLEEAGEIRRWPGARGIQLTRTRRPENSAETTSVPLVGEAPAGPTMVAEENVEGWVRLPRSQVARQGTPFFLLRVRGDSMNRASVAGEAVEDGDLVLVRGQSQAEAGQVVVALIDGEATIKRLAKGRGYHILQPQSTNKGHAPIIVNQGYAIQGVVCRVFKKGSELLTTLWEEP